MVECGVLNHLERINGELVCVPDTSMNLLGVIFVVVVALVGLGLITVVYGGYYSR